MKQSCGAENHALACIIAPVNGFGLASFMDIAKHIADTSYSSLWDGPGASYCYSASVIGILQMNTPID